MPHNATPLEWLWVALTICGTLLATVLAVGWIVRLRVARQVGSNGLVRLIAADRIRLFAGIAIAMLVQAAPGVFALIAPDAAYVGIGPAEAWALEVTTATSTPAIIVGKAILVVAMVMALVSDRRIDAYGEMRQPRRRIWPLKPH